MVHRVELRARANEHFVYSGRTLLVTNLDGWILGENTEGFYSDETRLLSRMECTIDGAKLKPIAVSPVGGCRFLAYFESPQSPGVPRGSVYLTLASRLDHGMRQDFKLDNYHSRELAKFELRIQFAADFADLSEINTGERQQVGDVATSWNSDCRELTFRYLHPDLDRAVAIRIVSATQTIRHEDGALIFHIELEPRESSTLQLATEPITDGTRHRAPTGVTQSSRNVLDQVHQHLKSELPILTTTNSTVSQAWATAVDDLVSLPLGLEPGPAAPIAGIPIYQQFFGRDMLTIGWQSLFAMKSTLRDALLLNAAWQGTVIDDWLDEEPGKMIHQARWGPLSELGIDPFSRYFGDYATPSVFLIALAQYLAWTNDMATVRGLLPAARKAIEWVESYADLDGDGFLEYLTRSRKGVENQGWKDSADAIVDEHGEVVRPPITVSELQAYWYAGLEQAAAVFFAVGDHAYALGLWRKARALQRRFDQAFWVEGESFYALGLGPDKRQLRSITSNTGHLLACGIVPVEKGKRVARRLMEPDLFSGWGIRTLSCENPFYNPFSYHRGSVWPVENGTIAFGLARYGCWDELHRLAQGVFDSAALFSGHRLSEAISGMPRDDYHGHPGIYPESNAPQGWSASMIVVMVQALLGLRPVAPFGLLLVDPHLPDWLPWLRIEGVRTAQSAIDLEFERKKNGETAYSATRRDGHVRVLRKPVPQGTSRSFRRQAAAMITSLPRS